MSGILKASMQAACPTPDVLELMFHMPDPVQPIPAADSAAPVPDVPATQATRPPEKHSSKASVLAAIASNIAVGIVKFIAAAISGSAAMVSEGIHSIVDSGNGFLVL